MLPPPLCGGGLRWGLLEDVARSHFFLGERLTLSDVRIVNAGAAALLLSPLGCGITVLEPILAQDDPCAAHAPAVCNADVANGCYFQPNRTGCLTTDSSCAAGECRAGDPFVRRLGDTLLLHDKPYRFVGANQYGMA